MPRRRIWSWDFAWFSAWVTLLIFQVWYPFAGSRLVDDSYSVELLGKKALYLLVERNLDYVDRHHAPLTEVSYYLTSETDTLCLLGPRRLPRAAEWTELLDWVEWGGVLVIAGRHDEPALSLPGLGAEIEPGTVTWRGLAGEKELESSLITVGRLSWSSNGQLKGAGLEPLVTIKGSLQAASLSHGSGTIILIASDDIFSNRALGHGANATLAYRLLTTARTPDTLLFDESLNETGTPKVVELLFDSQFRPFTLQLALVVLLIGWAGSRRFGPLLPADVPPRHDITDHTNALGQLYYRVRGGGWALQAYLDQLRGELQIRSGAKPDDSRLAMLAQRLEITAAELHQRLEAAESAALDPTLDRRAAARLIRDLAAIRNGVRRSPAGAGR